MSDREARQGGSFSESRAATVSDIQELMRRKEEIEAQIKANFDVLEGVSADSGQGGARPPAAGPRVSLPARPGRRQRGL
jgi:hypothetical protein